MTSDCGTPTDYTLAYLIGILALSLALGVTWGQFFKNRDKWDAQCIKMIYQTDLPQDVKDVMAQGVFQGNSELRSQIWSVAYSRQPQTTPSR